MLLMACVVLFLMAVATVFALSAGRVAKKQDEWDANARRFWEACNGE